MSDLITVSIALGPATLLAGFHASGLALKRRHRGKPGEAAVDDFLARSKGWWWVVGLFALAFLSGRPGVVVFMGAWSALALREFLRVSDTGFATDRWVPGVLIGTSFGLNGFVVFAPQAGWQMAPALVVPCVLVTLALRGESGAFLERSSRLVWGWLVCVYLPAFVSALAAADLAPREGHPLRTFFFVLFVVQLGDVLQYIVGRLFGRHLIIPRISPRKTWEGLLGGMVGAGVAGAVLADCTPFGRVGAASLAVACVVAGFLGGAVMSAVKRGYAVKDYGKALAGAGGVMDRIDGVCFSAPVAYVVIKLAAG